MSLNRNSRKQMLLMAVAAAAFICGSDFALAQRPEGGGQQGGANVQGQGGARVQGQGGARVQGGEQGGARQGGPGASQRSEQRSNMRGAQGPERSRGTTGQNTERLQERSRTSREQRDRGRLEGSTTGQSERRFEDRRDRSTTVGRGERTNFELNEQQRSRVRDVVISHRNIPRLSNVNFDVRVGTVVPRTVRFITVPEDIVRIYPRFRRHRIIIVGDEILIIDPVTFRIVAVLPA